MLCQRQLLKILSAPVKKPKGQRSLKFLNQRQTQLWNRSVIDAAPEQAEAPLPAGGLADAIARARTIKQEQAKTPRQLAQEKAGVRKI